MQSGTQLTVEGPPMFIMTIAVGGRSVVTASVTDAKLRRYSNLLGPASALLASLPCILKCDNREWNGQNR
jgi:hypothetical protein